MGFTVTVCAAVPMLPAASRAVQVTSVGPTGKASGASWVSETTLTLSVAVASPMSTEVNSPVARTTRSGGGVTTGG